MVRRLLWLAVIGLILAVIGGFILIVKPFGSIPRPQLILCMGDSLTVSAYGNYVQDLQRICTQEGLNVNVVAAARPGNTSGEYLSYLQREQPLSKINPHLVVLLLGTNDVRVDGDRTTVFQFSKNIRTILRILKAHRNPDGSIPRIFIASVPPIITLDLEPFGKESRQRIEDEIVPAIKRLAREEGVGLIDLHGRFSKRKALLPGIHPNAKGYRMMAKWIFEALHDYLVGVPPQKEERLPGRFSGKIAFQSDRAGNEDIYIISRQGVEQLTSSPAIDGSPCFSPDGKQLVFESDRSGRFEIYIRNPQGKIERLFSSPSQDNSPFWTADGKFVYFTRGKKRREEIYRYSFEDKGVVQVTDLAGRNTLPVLNRAGDVMLFTSNKLLGWNVYRYDLRSGKDEKISKGYGGCRARFSHDDNWIAWVSHKIDHKGDIFLTPANQFSPQRITLDGVKHDYCPCFSPDDRFIAYASGPKLYSGNYDLKIIEISTKKIWTITHSPAKDVMPQWINK